MSERKKHICILGAAESGIGAAVLAQKQGWDVFVSDSSKIKTAFKERLESDKISFEEGKHSPELILKAELIVKSPGIPDNAPIIVQAVKMGIPVISEIEFAARYTKAKLVAITGTNGKTTTTLLTYHILKNAGLNVGLAGNVGKSFALQVAENNFDVFVLEISSFMLDGMYAFKADVAILLNITPDHLDRYNHQFQKYVDSKFRIINNMGEEGAFIFCDDDPIIAAELISRKLKMKLYPFSLTRKVEQGAYVSGEQFNIHVNSDPLNMSIFELALQGKHNQYNSMAAGISARVFDIRKESVRESLSDFENIEHRLEAVAKVHGIEFINDSKATNVNSTWYALESMNHPVIWIVGGVDKGNDYNMLKDLVKQRVKAIVCLGKDNSKIHKAFEDTVTVITDTASAEEAVKTAYHLGKKGDVVLLSPACASFDLFENYEDRGRQFKKAVREL